MSRRRVAAQARFELRLLARNGENLLVTFVIPLAVLVFFTTVPVLPTGDHAAVDLLTPGTMTLAIMGSAMVSLGISTGFERDQLVLKRLAVTPLRRSELVAAKTLAVIALIGVQMILLLATAFVLGWRPAPTPVGILVAVVGLLLASFAFAGIGLAIAGRLPALRSLAVINLVFLAFLILAGVIVPLDALPAPLALLAQGLPPAWTTALLHATLGELGPPWPLPLAVLTGWCALAVLLASRTFRWE